MGIFDFFPCCGPREKKQHGDAASFESEALLAPPRGPASIISQEGYGATSMHLDGPSGGLTNEQRARIEEIGREAGGHMLPIHVVPRTATSSPTLTRGANNPASSSASATSSLSRPSSPSPMRPDSTPPGGMMRASNGGGNGEDEEDVEVIRKTVFLGTGGLGGGSSRRTSGRGRGKPTRGRGRGK